MEIYAYTVSLPPGINEMVTPCFDGYTIYIDSNLTYEGRMKAFRHALHHITHEDFKKDNVQEIESVAHKNVR